MDLNPVILSIPLYFILIGFELVHQLVTNSKSYRTNDAITNIGCGITSQVTNALWGVLSVAMYQYVYEFWSVTSIATNLWTNLLLFILVDFFYYWFHRASHEINFMWNTAHIVHHQSEDYNLSVALRQSSFGGVFAMLFYLPLAFMGFNTLSFLAIKGINLIYQFWIHTETINKLPKWFEFLFNTPSHHRVHHGKNPKYIDRNHAGTLMIWDRMFGTFQAEEERPVYGVTKPTNTWNPIWANLSPVVEMARELVNTSGFRNKLKLLFYKPGWRPKEMGGYQTAPEISKQSVSKYDVHPNIEMIRYLLWQFILILGFTSYFLFTHAQMSLEIKGFGAFYIMWSIGQLGMLMENRNKWLTAEIVRLIVSSVIVYFLLPTTIGLTISMALLFVGIIWLLKAK